MKQRWSVPRACGGLPVPALLHDRGYCRRRLRRGEAGMMSEWGARVLVADPPWPYRDKLPGNGRGAAKHYGLMTFNAIAQFPLPPLADVAYLFLWRVASMQEEALRIARAWGFVPKTELVWRKLTRGGKPHFGMGRYLRAAHETCIVAVRGPAAHDPHARNIRSVFDAPVGEHSEKPEAFYRLVEAFTHGPYVELFARRARAGWYTSGDELVGKAAVL